MTGELFALDVATGDLVWRNEIGEPVWSSRAVADGHVYLATEAFYNGSGESPSAVMAVDAATGENLWKYEPSIEGLAFFSSPTISEDMVYIGSQGEDMGGVLIALDAATGEEAWTFQPTDSFGVISSPAVVDGTVFVGSDALYAVDAQTGEPNWRLGMGSIGSSPAVVDGVVYIISEEGFLVAADATTGQELWHQSIGGGGGFVPQAPAIAEGMAFVNGLDGFFYAFGEVDSAATPVSAAGKENESAQATGESLQGTVILSQEYSAEQLPPAPAYLGAYVHTWPEGAEYVRDMDDWKSFSTYCVVQGEWSVSAVGNASATPVAVAAAGDAADETHVGVGECITLQLGGQRVERNVSDGETIMLQVAGTPEDYPGSEGRDPAISDLWLAGFDQPQLDLLGPGPWQVELGQVELAPDMEVAPHEGEGLSTVGGPFDTTTHLSRRPDGSVRNLGEEPVTAYVLSVNVVDQGESASQAAAVATPVAEASDGPATTLWQLRGGVDPFAGPADMAIAPDGNIWVSDGQRDRFQIFTPDGAFIETWGESGTGDGEFDFSRANGNTFGALAFAPDGTFYVVDTGNRRVQQFDAERNFVRSWGGFGTLDGQFVDPIALALDAQGNVYVADDRRDDIQKFDASGVHVQTFGEHGKGPGQLSFLGAPVIDAEGRLFVADYGNNRVQVFNPDGSAAMSWGEPGSEPGQFQGISDVTVDADGRIFVADSDNRRIQIFDADGAYLGEWGSEGDGPGQFLFPVAIALDGAGNAYVVDVDLSRVQKFALDLSALMPAATPVP